MTDELKKIDQIIEDSKLIKTDVIATEVVEWILNNVESFIDNHTKTFRMDLVLDSSEGLLEAKKLQDLYRAIPDKDIDASQEEIVEKSQECRRVLDEITKKAFDQMKEQKDLLTKLFNKMIFFYERIIPSPENKKRALEIDAELKALFAQKDEIKEESEATEIKNKIIEKIKEGENLIKFERFRGAVNIINFEYEAFEVGVKITHSKKDPNPDGDDDIEKIADLTEQDKEVTKSYNIPEGFSVWLEIVFKHQQRPTAVF